MKKIIKMLSILIAIVIGLFLKDVNARTNSGILYGLPEIDSGVNVFAQDMLTGAMDYNSWRIISDVDNKIYYCIEPEQPFFTRQEAYVGAYTIKEGSDIVSNTRLTDAMSNRVQLLAYYGYGFKNHTDKKWYGITQVMIWRTVITNAYGNYKNTTWEFKNGRYGNVDKNLYIKEVNELESLVSNHGKKPSFDGATFKVNIGETITITDNNNALNNFIMSSTKYVDIKVEGNKLLITGKKIGEENINLTNDIGITETYSAYLSDKQDVINRGKVTYVNSNFKVVVEGGELNLTKKDRETNSTIPQGEATLLGAKYVILKEDGSVYKEITIDTLNKKIELPYGKYKIKEIEPPKGYKLSTEEYDIELNAEQKEINLDLFDFVIKGTHIVNKYKGGLDEKFIEEANAIFEVRDKNNKLVGEIKTYKKGVGTITLPYGHYTIIQVKGAENYAFIEPYEINITEDKQEIEVDLENIKYSKLLFQKVDLKTGKGLANAKIEVYTENDELVFSGLTNSSGLLEVENLPIGRYYLIEKEAPKYYKITSEKLWFDVSENGTIIKKIMKDERYEGKLQILKKDKDTNKPLKGVTFNIYDALTNEIAYTITTDEFGYVKLDHVLAGKYYLIEKEALKGYQKLDKKIYFEITKDETIELEIYNEKEIENPDTKDNIIGYLLLLSISIFSIATIYITFKKNN